MDYLTKIILVTIGSFCVTLGILGILLPLLPTTPLLLLAAVCYARSSEKFHNWLINNKLLGKFIKDYHEGRGIPFKGKVLAISMLWITILGSVIFIIPIFFVKVFLILIAVSVTIYILSIKTYRQ